MTGASSGMGKAIAKRLVEDGYQVYAAARHVERMDDLAQLGFKETSMDDVARAARLSSAGTVFALCEQDRAVPRIASPRARGESARRRPIEHVGGRVTGPPAP